MKKAYGILKKNRKIKSKKNRGKCLDKIIPMEFRKIKGNGLIAPPNKRRKGKIKNNDNALLITTIISDNGKRCLENAR